MLEWGPAFVALLTFGGVTASVFVLAQRARTEGRIERRLRVAAHPSEIGTQTQSAWAAFLAKYFSEKAAGGNSSAQGKLRKELVQAGYFSPDGASYYRFARVVSLAMFAVFAIAIAGIFLANKPLWLRLLVVAIAAGMGFAAPRAYLARRKRLLTQRFRQVYPDFLDLLVVCVDAGLGVEAALERITSEIGKQSREFAVNLTWLAAETRAGRSLTDALENFADRISLDEARSLVLALRQSATLGSNLAHALVVYSADMRERRLLRAEAEANKLPVKIMAPLGLLIFPVILLVVALPALVRLVPIFLRH